MTVRCTISYVLLLVSLVLGTLQGQSLTAIEGGFTIKEHKADSITRIAMGKVYYDKNIQKLVYDVKFPQNEVWVLQDSTFYQLVDKKIINQRVIPPMVRFSIFHLSLNHNLANYGLEENSPYTIEDIRKEDSLVIVSWSPPPALSDQLGKVVLAQMNNKLYGIQFFDKSDELISKQFFEEYSLIQGIPFPHRIVQIYYEPAGKRYKVTELENIRIQMDARGKMYDYPLPASP